MMTEESSLSPAHQQFINEYLKGHCSNATAAYLIVYPKATRESARREASRLLTNVDIADELKRRIAEEIMSADEVMLRISEQARAAYSDYIKKDGSINVAKLIADGKAHLIKGIRQGKRRGKEYEFYDAFTALKLIGTHHELFAEKVNVHIERELEKTLDLLEQKLSPDEYQRILGIIGSQTVGADKDNGADS